MTGPESMLADGASAAPPASAHPGLDRDNRAGHGRQQPEPVPARRARREPGQRRRSVADRRLALELRGRVRLDGAGPDVPGPRRRHRRVLRRGLPTLQPGAVNADRRVLLVGLGADLRADGDSLGLGDHAVVPAGCAGAAAGDRAGAGLHAGQPGRRPLGHAIGDPDRRGLRRAGARLWTGAGAGGHRRLAAGVQFPPRLAVRRACSAISPARWRGCT